ncbi:MAG: DUF2865 domain-containing protein [Hyphomicrobiales bacterium]|nr:DUF2865 domain-containing protein [Hyphomicrobiales bacterium]
MKRTATLFIAIATVFSALEARAETSLCATLEARLASIDRGTSGQIPGAEGTADPAIARQRHELEQAQAAARRNECHRLIKVGKRARHCSRLTASVERLKARLGRLELGATAAANPSRERKEVLNALAANGCGERYATHRVKNRRHTGLFRSLLGGRRVFRDRGGFGAGTYRTLCVRTCDGYYFPVSFAATPAAFQRDAGACQALCPGTDVALYVHRNPGQESPEMVSLTGEPYTAQPNAFRYRTEYDRSCRCPSPVVAATAPVTIMGAPFSSSGNGPPDASLMVGSVQTAPDASAPGVPIPRPAADTADPETAANRIGGFTPGPALPEPPTKLVIAAGPDGRPVRIVGPSFLAPSE